MSDPDKEKLFVANVKKALDLDTKNLDPVTQDKLARARRKALRSGERKGFDIREWFTVPVMGWATACVFALGLVYFMQPTNGTLPPLEDIDLLVAEDNLEFYDRLEFYAWLAEENGDAAG